MINHLTFPDQFGAEMETTISLIVSFTDDPLMKAIVICPGQEGTIEAFRRVRALRPDILLFASYPQEDPAQVSGVADLSLGVDTLSRGYLSVLQAKMLGADTVVFTTFPRHMSYELLSRMRDIMRVASEEMGLKFVSIGVQDPASDAGVSAAQQYIIEKFPSWLDEYGKNAAFFTTNTALHEPLIRQVAMLGGIYIEGDTPSPILGYPGALGVEFAEEDKGDWQKLLKKVEEKVVSIGASGRMSVWTYGPYYTFGVALGEHARRVIEGESELLNKDDIFDAIAKYTPGAGWNSSYYVDADGVEKENFLLLYEDTYVFGKGYLNLTSEVVPEKYYDVNIGKN